DLCGVNLRIGVYVDDFLLEDARELFRYFLVFHRQQLQHHVHECYLGTTAGEDGGELASHRPCSDDQHRLRHLAQQQDVIGVDDAFAVGLDVRQVLRYGAHGQDDVLGG